MHDHPRTVESDLPPPRPRRRWIVWVGLLLAVPALAVTLLLLGVQYWQAGSQRDLDQRLAGLRAARIPTTPAELDAAYQLPADCQDCTQSWLEAIEPLLHKSRELSDCDLPFLGRDELPPPDQAWSQLEESVALLARYQQSLDVLHAAAQCDGTTRYPTNFAAGYTEPSNERGVALACGLLSLQALVRIERSDTHAALQSLDAAHRLSSTLDGHLGYVAINYRCFIDRNVHLLRGRSLAVGPLDEQQLAKMMRQCAEVDYQAELLAAVRTERVLAQIAFEQLDQYAYLIHDWAGEARWLFTVTEPCERAHCLDVFEMLEAGASGSVADVLSAHQRVDALLKTEMEVKDPRHQIWLSLMLAPNFDSAVRAIALRDAAICGLAAERYRLRHGQWPEALAELPPDLLPESWEGRIPVDPFNGLPFKYIVARDGLRVYSVGINGRDDGGDSWEWWLDAVFHIPRASDP